LTAEFRYLPCTLRSHPVTSNIFLEFRDTLTVVNWTLLASRARALPCIAHDPEVHVRDFGTSGHHRTQRLQHRHRPAEADYEVKTYSAGRRR